MRTIFNLILLVALLSCCNYSIQKPPAGANTNLSDDAAPASDMHWLQERLLQSKCVSCHTSSRAPGGFSFDSNASLKTAIAKGAISPGNHSTSLLSQVIMSGSMPPSGVEPRASEKEILILNCWIDRGAVDTQSICWEKFSEVAVVPPSGNGSGGTPPSTGPIVVNPPEETTSDFEWVSTQLFQPTCGGCHNDSRPRAGYVFSSLEGLKQALTAGVTPGNSATSIIVQVIDSGRMPPLPNAKPTATQIHILKCWIDGGAITSGNNCWKKFAADIPTVSPPPPDDNLPAELNYATVNKKVFSPYCVACHNRENATSNVNLESLNMILNPPRGPALVKCGKPNESLLFKVVKDDEMPYEESPLPSELKQLLFDWISKDCQ